MAKKKNTRKKIIFILLLLFMLATIGYFYVNRVLLPVKIKQLVIEKAQTFLNRPVSIGKISYQPIKGVVLNDIQIGEKKNDILNKKAFVDLKEVSFNLVWSPLFFDKKVIIPTIRLHQPAISLTRNNDQTWNITDLLTPKESQNQNSEYQVFLKRLIITDGRIDYTDHTQTETLYETLKQLNIDINLSIKKHINFVLGVAIPRLEAAIKMDGTYYLDDKSLSTKLKLSNFDFAHYLNLFYTNETINIEKGFIPNAKLEISYKPNDVALKGDIEIDALAINDGKQFLSTNIKGENVALTHSEEHATAEGYFEFINSEISLPETSLKSDSASSTIQLTQKENTFTIKGDIQSKGTFLRNNTNEYSMEEFVAKNINITKAARSFKLQSDYDFTDILIKLGTTTRIKGNLKANNHLFTMSLTGNVLRGDYVIDNAFFADADKLFRGNITTKNAKISFNKETLELNADLEVDALHLNYDPNLELISNVNAKNVVIKKTKGKLETSARLQLDALDATFQEIKINSERPTINISYQHKADELIPHTYSGSVEFNNTKIEGAAFIERFENLFGVIKFKNDYLDLQKIKGDTANTTFFLSGSLENFKQPLVDLEIDIPSTSFQTIYTLFPDLKTKYPVVLDGSTSITGNYKGLVRSPETAAIQALLKLKDTTVSSEKLPEDVTNVSAEITYSPDQITWNGLKGIYKDTSYSLEGSLRNFDNPQVETSLQSRDLAFVAILDKTDSLITIEKLKGTYFSSDFNMIGKLDLSKPTDPYLNARGAYKLHLHDLILIFPKQKSSILALQPEGTFNGNLNFIGPIKKWQYGKIFADGESSRVKLGDFTLYNNSLKLTQEVNKSAQLDILTTLYDGTISVNSKIDMAREAYPLTATARVERLDLDKLRKDRKMKKKQFGGKLRMVANLNGSAKDLKNIRGEGALIVSEGYIWSLIPQYQDIIFTDAQAEFSIANQMIDTPNLVLISPKILLKGRGTVGFDQYIKFNFIPVPADTPTIDAGGFQIDPSSVLLQVASIQCEGSIKKPNCTPEVNAGKVFETTTDILKEGVRGIGGILGEILNQ